MPRVRGSSATATGAGAGRASCSAARMLAVDACTVFIRSEKSLAYVSSGEDGARSIGTERWLVNFGGRMGDTGVVFAGCGVRRGCVFSSGASSGVLPFSTASISDAKVRIYFCFASMRLLIVTRPAKSGAGYPDIRLRARGDGEPARVVAHVGERMCGLLKFCRR